MCPTMPSYRHVLRVVRFLATMSPSPFPWQPARGRREQSTKLGLQCLETWEETGLGVETKTVVETDTAAGATVGTAETTGVGLEIGRASCRERVSSPV